MVARVKADATPTSRLIIEGITDRNLVSCEIGKVCLGLQKDLCVQ